MHVCLSTGGLGTDYGLEGLDGSDYPVTDCSLGRAR